MRKLMLATAALCLAAAPAFAQQFSNTPAGPQTNYQSNGNSYSGQEGWHNQQYGQHAQLRHHIYRELSQAGFSDIHIMPRSFMVRARDPQGNQVMMILTPNSVAAVTAVPNGSRNGNQYGQNSEMNRFGPHDMNGNTEQFRSNSGTTQYSQNSQGQNWSQGQNGNHWGPTGSSAMNNSGQSGNAINSPNGNGTND